MDVQFSRKEILSALRQLLENLPDRESITTIRIVGGAALALNYFERRLTFDIDAVSTSSGEEQLLLHIAHELAKQNNWPESWFNFEVMKADAIPRLGKTVEWEKIYAENTTVIEVASAEALLAMKLRANRQGRDTDDIRNLMGLCDKTTMESLEELYESYYPGDVLPARAVLLVERILAAGIPQPPEKLPPLEF